MGLYRSGMECGFTPTDKDNIIAEKIWPIVKGIIMTCIENNQNIIIEGCYILPHLVKDFEQQYLEKIISVFIAFSKNYICKNFTSSIIKHRNVIETRGYSEDRTINLLIDEHSFVIDQCKLNDIDYIEIENDYEIEIDKVFTLINSKMIW
jgi:putative acetyltransferase